MRGLNKIEGCGQNRGKGQNKEIRRGQNKTEKMVT